MMDTIFLFIGSMFLVLGILLFAAMLITRAGLFALIPAVFIVLGAFFVFYILRKRHRRKKLLGNGRKVWAQITEVRPNYQVTINGRNPYIITCEAGGRIFRGDYEKPVQSDLLDKSVPVYISQEDPEQYYVDLSSL